MESLKLLAKLAKERPNWIAFQHYRGKIKLAMSTHSDEWTHGTASEEPTYAAGNDRVVSIWYCP
ncbi:MAG: hypothetical protein WC455_16635 [Dehalococcoidia bacterium]|jgi:hypothetical protein